MEHMHLVVNLANESANDTKNNVVGGTGGAIKLKINKALLISKRQSIFFNEEYYKYAIEIKVNTDYWVIFRFVKYWKTKNSSKTNSFKLLRKYSTKLK